MPILIRAETLTLPDHKVYFLSLLCLCVFLVLGTACHDMASCLPLIQRKTGSVFQSPSVSSNSSSNSVSNSSNLFWSWRLRWVQLALTTDWRSAFSYLASRTWATLWVASCVLCGLCAILLFTVQALSIFDMIKLLMSLIGKIISSIVISFCLKIENNS